MQVLDDLSVISLLTAIFLGTAVLAPHGPARVVLALPIVLFCPGYVLLVALYPRRYDLEGIERYAFSVGVSLAITPFIALAINTTPWGLRSTAIAVGLALFVWGCALLAAYRRRPLAAAERFGPESRELIRIFRHVPWPRLMPSAVVMAIVLVLGFQFVLPRAPRVAEPFTEFYLLGPARRPDGYPGLLLAGQKGAVILGIVNQEGRAARYSVRVMVAGEPPRRLGPIVLDWGQKWEESLAFSVRHPADRAKIEFLLFKDDDRTPYREIHLWATVRSLVTPPAGAESLWTTACGRLIRGSYIECPS